MIEKLDDIKHTEFLYDKKGFITKVADGGVIISKINELVDAVNELQKSMDLVQSTLVEEPDKAEPADPFAEQRRWIGKLCRFWDNSDVDYSLALLTKIIEKEPMPFEDYRGNQWYHCEPVKPDDDIIYKGE